MKNLTLLVVLSLSAGCANLSVPSTGFLENREQLMRNKEHEVWGIPDEVHLYVAPDLDASKYDSIWVERALYMPSVNVAHQPSAESISGLEMDFQERLKAALGKDFKLVDQAGPRTLHVRSSIAEVSCERVWLNILAVILVVPVSMGGISGEIEVLDSLSKQRLIAMAAHRDGTPFLVLECFNKYAHARWGMRKWSTKLRKLLAASKGA